MEHVGGRQKLEITFSVGGFLMMNELQPPYKHTKNTQVHLHPYTHRTTPCFSVTQFVNHLTPFLIPVISSLPSFLLPSAPLSFKRVTTEIWEWEGTFILLEKEPYLSLWGRSINSIWLLQRMHLYVVQCWKWVWCRLHWIERVCFFVFLTQG